MKPAALYQIELWPPDKVVAQDGEEGLTEPSSSIKVDRSVSVSALKGKGESNG